MAHKIPTTLSISSSTSLAMRIKSEDKGSRHGNPAVSEGVYYCISRHSMETFKKLSNERRDRNPGNYSYKVPQGLSPLYCVWENTCMSKEPRRKKEKEILKLMGLSSPKPALARDGDTGEKQGGQQLDRHTVTWETACGPCLVWNQSLSLGDWNITKALVVRKET